MVGLPDEDGPTMSSAELEAAVRAENDGAPSDDAEDGPTVQATVSSEVAKVAPAAAPSAPRPGPPRPGPPRPDSKPKLAPTPPAPPVSAVPPTEEEEQDSITATAPRVDTKAVLLLPAIEGSEEDLETEVKTMTGAHGAALVAALAAVEPAPKPAPPPPPPPPPPDEDDDGATMTAQAPAPANVVPETGVSPLGDDAEDDDEDGETVNTVAPNVKQSAPDLGAVVISTKSLMEPSTLTGTGDAPTKPGIGSQEAPTKSGVTDAPTTEKEYEPEDSITSRALAKHEEPDDYEEDSVTTQAVAPSVGAVKGRLPASPIGDDGDDTTQRKGSPPASPADDEQESITQQAPGHLTNMLRVIASDRRSTPEAPVAAAVVPMLDDDEPPENKTAVMPNAPVKNPGSHPMKHGTLQGMGPVSPPSTRPPATAPLGASASAAPRLDPGSESGMRVAHETVSGEHASLGAMLGADKRMSAGRVGIESEARIAHAATEPAVFPLPSPDDAPIPPSPRYGLLVTVVAAVCIIIPVALYVFLSSNKDEAVVPGVPAQPSADLVKRDDTIRQKFVKPTKGKHH